MDCAVEKKKRDPKESGLDRLKTVQSYVRGFGYDFGVGKQKLAQ